MIWPFKRRQEVETRSGFPVVTQTYIDHRRKELASDGPTALSATVGTCVGVWSRAFTMMTPTPADLLTPDVLASIGQDLCLRGNSVWHIRVEQGQAKLARVAYWDEFEHGRYHLHIARVNSTETVKALAPEVLKLVINADAATPWIGRSPFALMGLSPTLMAEVEAAISGAMPMTGKGLLPLPSTIPEEQQSKVLSGLRNGSLATVMSKQDYGHQTGGDRSEFRRVELTPDLKKMELNPAIDSLHHRILNAAGIPPALVTGQGNAGAMREAYRLFALTTMEPLARQLMPELQAKLAVQSVHLEDMLSADVAGRARAVGILTGAGMSLDDALTKVGWSA